MERHADHLDQANQVTEAATTDAVERYRRLAAPEQDPDNIDPCCALCGEDIEAGRLELLKKHCFACQTKLERNNKLYW